jgi:plasmid stability protein
MSVPITIREVPERLRDELAARAARQGKSLQEVLRAELVRMASRTSDEARLKQLRARKQMSRTQVSSREILRSRDADRR